MEADIIQNTPILFPINPGVSLQSITVLPNFTSQNLLIISLKLLLFFSEDTISSNLRYLGGLKKCVMKKLDLNFEFLPSVNFFNGIVDVFDETIKLSFIKSSIFSYRDFFIFKSSIITSITQSLFFIR